MAAQLELSQRPFIELEIEALCQDNRIKPKRVSKFINELEAKLKTLDKINYTKLLNKTFRLPLVGRPNSVGEDYPKEFKFKPPKKLHTVGGHRTLTSLKRTHYVDLAVEMPSSCIGQKDVKNQRYHQRRALYLCQIAHLLNGTLGLKLVKNLEFRYFNGDLYKPVLLIAPKSAKLNKKIVFQLFVVPDTEEFNIKLGTLSPDHGNIAPKWFFRDYNFQSPKQDEELSTFIEADSDACPSPFYNSSILFDAELISNSEMIVEHVVLGTSISESLTIAKIWLFQRELHGHFSFILSMLTAYLQSRQKIHENMSSYQIFKILIKTLLETDWATEGFSYFDDHKDKLPQFMSHFPVVFLSPSGRLNICYNITIDLYKRLKHEAKLANEMLNSNSPDVFEFLFLRPVTFNDKFDVIVHLPKSTKKIPETLEYAKWLMDYGVLTSRVHSKNIMRLIDISMTDRVELAQQKPYDLLMSKKWSLKGIPYDPQHEEHVFTFGLLLDAERALRIIDIGPKAQTKEAEEFQEFWDPKSQLRLQNGVISETVVWHVNCFSQRRAIIKYILDHALKRAQIPSITAHYTQLERFIDLKNVFFRWRDDAAKDAKAGDEEKPAKENESKATVGESSGKRKRSDGHEKSDAIITAKPLGVGEEVFLKALYKYNELNKVLRSVESMKHSITSIQPTSHHLRASGIFPPLPVGIQKRNKSLKRHKGVTTFPENFNQIGKILYIEPIEVLVTLDSTSQWPSQLEPLEAEKLDYLITLGEKLKAKEYTVSFAEDYLDVLCGQFVFRVRVRCQKELLLVSQARGKQEFQRRRYEHEILPRVHGALDQLYRQKPAYSTTCRIVKRWISCHLMVDYINDITVDLLVAHLFLHPEPFTEPSSSTCGFKRFLKLMAQHDWKELPLIVNLEGQFKIDEIRKLREVVQKERNKYPLLTICTPFDRERPSPWTMSEPSEHRLQVFQRICSKGSEFFNGNILSSLTVDFDEYRSMFRPNFKLFHLVIKLHNSVVQTYCMSIDPPKDLKLVGREQSHSGPSALKVMPIVNLNAVEQFVKLLREKYDDVAWFYYDKYGQRVIGVEMKTKPEKLSEGEMSNFMRELKITGHGLVDEVSVVKRND